MGYQPPLDGLRAISVVAVMLYHGGFGWLHGGFLGVEVFFVISGYLITVLLIEERRGSGTVALGAFWMRRARRLLPALVAMLVVIAAWVAVFGSPAQQWQMRRDLPWALGYAANWGQIVGGTAYFEPVDPPVLRHLWSLAVEEQWYVVWPLAFLLLVRSVRERHRRAAVLATVAVLAGALMWWVGATRPGRSMLRRRSAGSTGPTGSTSSTSPPSPARSGCWWAPLPRSPGSHGVGGPSCRARRSTAWHPSPCWCSQARSCSPA